MRRLVVAAALVLGLVAGMIPAGAHTLTVSDPNDTQGRLDIREAALFHKGSGNDLKYIWIIRTYDRWFPRHVNGDNGDILIQIKRSQESSWQIKIKKAQSGGLKARLSMCIEAQGCGQGDEENYEATRPNKKSVRVKVPAADLGGVGDKIKWRVVTRFGNAPGESGDWNHIDIVPNSGLATHDLN